LCVCFSGKDRTEKKLLGLSYLRLSADDLTTVSDGSHELHLHKVRFLFTISISTHFRFKSTFVSLITYTDDSRVSKPLAASVCMCVCLSAR